MNCPNTGNSSAVSVEGQCMNQHRIFATDNIGNIN